MEWSIIIFCFNEEKNIGKVIQSTIDFLNQPNYNNSEIIIINDGSKDQTEAVIQSYAHQFPQLIIQHLTDNQGIGNALNLGYDLSTKEYVCAIPGDGQFNIQELQSIQPFGANEFITFYRETKNYNIYRSLLTHFNLLFNKWVLKIDVPDVNWIKVYRQHQISKDHRQLNSSLVETEICAKLIKSNHTHIDYPSIYLDREHGIAKGGNWHTLKKAMAEIMQLYFIVRRYSSTS